YAYNGQPNIGAWNLARFAEALLPLFSNNEDEALALAKKELGNFKNLFEYYWQEFFLKKIGLTEHTSIHLELVKDLLSIMEDEKRDFTETFRALSIQDEAVLNLETSPQLKTWYEKWIIYLSTDIEAASKLMKKVNPAVIPRNYLVEDAILEVETTG